MLATFDDDALFSDGAGFALWRPPLFAIVSRRHPMLVFHDPVHREREFALHRPLIRRYSLLEMTDGGGSMFDVWLSRQGAGVKGHIDLTPWCGPPRCALSWTPVHGLDAGDTIVWATETFGLDNAKRFRAALAETCAQAWADLPR